MKREIATRRFCNSGNGTTAVTRNTFYSGKSYRRMIRGNVDERDLLLLRRLQELMHFFDDSFFNILCEGAVLQDGREVLH